MLQIKTWFSNFTSYRWRSLLAVAGMVVIGVGLAHPSQAGVFGSLVGFTKDGILFLISTVLYFFLILIMGLFTTIATKVLVYVAQLNHFTDLPVIIEAWSVVRDLANMFFIVILLVIAFGTLFRLEAYSWKKLLPKMVLAAILVNYSRAICGVIVDASQVVMLTFVAAIKDAAAVGLAEAFNLDQLLQFGDSGTSSLAVGDETNAATTSSQQRLVAIVAAGFMLATMFMVQCVYVVVLIARVVIIWFLTVLSPLAYITSVLPQTERYSRQWWEMFGRYVVVGPLCMFFLWLTMFIASRAVESGGLGAVASTEAVGTVQVNNLDATGAAALDTTLITGFLISTLMLMAGMKLAQENSSEISEYTGKAANFGKLFQGAVKFIGYGGAIAGATALGIRGASYVNDRQAMRTGYDLNLPRVWKRWKHGLDVTARRRENVIEATAGVKYLQGDLLAGALGAGDQVIETGFTLDQFRGSTGKEKKFRQALTREQAADEEQVEAEEVLATTQTKHRKSFRTNQQFEDEQNQLNASRDEATGIEIAYGLDPDMEFDMKNTAHHALVKLRIENLQSTLSDSTVSQADKLKNTDEIFKLKKGLQMNKFKKTDIGVDMSDAVIDYSIQENKAAADHLANKALATNNGENHTQGDIEKFIDTQADVIAAKARLAHAEHALHEARHERHTLSPKMGLDWETKFRAAVSEEASKIKTTDADTLIDMFVEAVENKKEIEMAALYEKLCETGNDNEPYKHYKLEFSANGAQALAKIMEKAGLNQQAVYSTMHRGAQLSEAAGHTPVTQLFDTKGSIRNFRPIKKQRLYAKGEEAKKPQQQHQANSTRLRAGEFGPKYVPEERHWFDSTIKNTISTAKTNGEAIVNTNFLIGLMKSKERWQVFQEETRDQLSKKQADDVIKKIREKCDHQGIIIAD